MRHRECHRSRAMVAVRSARIVHGARACALIGLIVLAACQDDTPTQAVAPVQKLYGAVTGRAAAAMGPDGRIQLAAQRVGAERELSAAEAVAIATTFTHDYAPMTRAWFERTHGATIDFKSLTSCGRSLYARSAFDAPSSIPDPYRRVHGPWWLVTMCDASGSPSVSVAVSAWATDISIENGKLRFPRIGGNEIVPIGVPFGHVGEYPSSPEVAIDLTARQTGRRISEVPELVTPVPADGPPQMARWRLTLDGPASVRTQRGARATTEVFVGPSEIGRKGLVASVAAPAQPASIDMDWVPMPVAGELVTDYSRRAARQKVKIERRANATVLLEPISTSETP